MEKGSVVGIKNNKRNLTLSLDNILNATIPRVIMPRNRDDSVRHEKSATPMVATVRMTGSKISMVNCQHAFRVFMLASRILVLLSAKE
jgi:hypothetical protein